MGNDISQSFVARMVLQYCREQNAGSDPCGDDQNAVFPAFEEFSGTMTEKGVRIYAQMMGLSGS